MTQQFTPEEIAEGEWYVKTAFGIRQDARVFERKRNLSESDVLARVKPEEKERFLKAKDLHEKGAGRYL